MINTINIILLFCFTIILGYLGQLFYSRTKIPDVIWLLLFGIILGPILHLYDPSLFIRLSSLMSILALCIILFDAGINVDIGLFVKMLPTSITVLLFTYPITMLLVGLTLNFFMPDYFDLLQGLLLGSMISGTSTVTTMSIVKTLEDSGLKIDRVKTTLLLESVLTDPIGIITCITLIRMIMMPETSLFEGFKLLFLSFSNSIILGSIIGVVWGAILDRLENRKFNYMLTLAIVFLTYIVSESIGGEGSGALSVLLFGLVITNFEYIASRLEVKKIFKVNKKQLREFHEEITFFIKSFFFVYIGLIISISPEQLFSGLAVSILVLVERWFAGTVSEHILNLSEFESIIIKTTCASGLPALIMSQLPMIYDPNRTFFLHPEIYPNICFIVVLITVIYGALITPSIVFRKIKTITKSLK